MAVTKKGGEPIVKNRDSRELAEIINKAQESFQGVAEAMGLNGEDDVQRLVDEVRYGTNPSEANLTGNEPSRNPRKTD